MPLKSHKYILKERGLATRKQNQTYKHNDKTQQKSSFNLHGKSGVKQDGQKS